MNLGFLCSHGGTNMQAIINAVNNGKLNANLAAMVSNNSDSFAIERATNAGMPTLVVNKNTISTNIPEIIDENIIEFFYKYNVDTVVLAGYMKIVSHYLINSFNNRVLNIHPALLPKYGGRGMFGINVHKAVIAAKEMESGATIHQVNSDYDQGRILAQMCVPVLADDTPETLAERVLEVEHIIYPDTLIKIEKRKIIL